MSLRLLGCPRSKVYMLNERAFTNSMNNCNYVSDGSWTSRTPANSYPRQDVPEIRDSRLVPSLLGCLPSRTPDGSYPRQVVPWNSYPISILSVL